jgi:hypothetical protein
MTKNRLLAGATLAVALMTATTFTSCNNDDEIGNADAGDALSLQSQMGAPETRATSTNSWDGGETVQVLVDGATPAIIPFTAAVGGVLTPQTTLYWNDYSPSGISATAWYPGGYTYPTDQSAGAGGIQAADFIFAPQVTGIAKSNFATKQLQFVHKTAKVTVNLSAGAGIPDISGATVPVTVAFYGKDDVTSIDTTATGNGAIAAGSTWNWVTPYRTSNTYTALLLPADVSGQFVRVEVDGEYYYWTPTTLNLEAGKRYTLDITVKKTGLTVASTISDWTADPGGTISGDAQ